MYKNRISARGGGEMLKCMRGGDTVLVTMYMKRLNEQRVTKVTHLRLVPLSLFLAGIALSQDPCPWMGSVCISSFFGVRKELEWAFSLRIELIIGSSKRRAKFTHTHALRPCIG